MKLVIKRDGSIGDRSFEKGAEYEIPEEINWTWANAIQAVGIGKVIK